jgi:hypothetical protein
LVCLIIYSVMQKGGTKLIAISVLILASWLIFTYKDLLFGGYIEMTSRQLEGDDYIRFQSGKYFLLEYWPSWLTVITGNGLSFIGSQYGKEIEHLKNFNGYYTSDVGIIGSLNTLGIFYVLNVFWMLFNMLRIKLAIDSDRYLKLVALNALLLILLTDYFLAPYVIPFWCMILYLLDKSAQRKKESYSSARVKGELEFKPVTYN